MGGGTNLEETLTEINGKLVAVDTEQATQNKRISDTESLSTQTKNRLDNLIPQGTTTEGNVELIDIRNGYFGNNYKTAGEAIRKQIGYKIENLGELVTEKKFLEAVAINVNSCTVHDTINVEEKPKTYCFTVEPFSSYKLILSQHNRLAVLLSNKLFDEETRENISGVIIPSALSWNTQYEYNEMNIFTYEYKYVYVYYNINRDAEGPLNIKVDLYKLDKNLYNPIVDIHWKEVNPESLTLFTNTYIRRNYFFKYTKSKNNSNILFTSRERYFLCYRFIK